jgi:hypothetical protein
MATGQKILDGRNPAGAADIPLWVTHRTDRTNGQFGIRINDNWVINERLVRDPTTSLMQSSIGFNWLNSSGSEDAVLRVLQNGDVQIGGSSLAKYLVGIAYGADAYPNDITPFKFPVLLNHTYRIEWVGNVYHTVSSQRLNLAGNISTIASSIGPITVNVIPIIYQWYYQQEQTIVAVGYWHNNKASGTASFDMAIANDTGQNAHTVTPQFLTMADVYSGPVV